jgi:hypothetical protein
LLKSFRLQAACLFPQWLREEQRPDFSAIPTRLAHDELLAEVAASYPRCFILRLFGRERRFTGLGKIIAPLIASPDKPEYSFSASHGQMK